ncbi:MAG: histidine phosphatase family protein [Dehalococcoidales bacterium]|jgi:broad specificity phosphatase PhoE|nr:hypothetical protein [Dehalococcoidales bacterium]MDP6631931.1 histidine phosphatase family protein [Dehalococcoidales bacterium]
MKKIILARHGETAWNVEEIFRGRIDVELNETGRRQAQLLAGHLLDINIEAVYSSPLSRALETAEAIAGRRRLEVDVSAGLMDLDFGEWQGLSRREVTERYPALHEEWLNHPERVRFPAGGSLSAVRERATGLIDELIGKHTGTLVLVSHRVVNKVLICALLGLDDSHFWNISQDTCAITTFDYEQGRFVLAGHNQTSYLKSIPKIPPV